MALFPRDFGGIQNNLKIPGSALSFKHSSPNKVQHVISFNAFWKFLRLRNSEWDVLGVNFFVQGSFRVLLEALGIFWVMIFAPIQSFPSLEIQK